MKKIKKQLRTIITYVIVSLLTISMFTVVFAAAPLEENVVTDMNNPLYMALSKYAHPTHVPNVFKVQTRVTIPKIIQKRPAYVCFVLDESGSMTQSQGQDIWDSKQGKFIKRLDAIKIATQKAIDVFIDDENEDIAISIVAYDNAVYNYTNGFENLYLSPGVVNPKFANVSTGALAAYGTHTGGTVMSGGLKQAYLNFRAASASIPSDASRYVLLMTDGNENEGAKAFSEAYAAILKAPASDQLPVLSYTPLMSWMNPPTIAPPSPGQSCTIWSIVLGHGIQINTHWKDYFYKNPWNQIGPGIIPNATNTSGPFMSSLDQWFDWDTQNRTIVTKTPYYLYPQNSTYAPTDRGNSELHLIQLSLDLKGGSYSGFPTDTYLVAGPSYESQNNLVDGQNAIHQWYTTRINSINNSPTGNAHYYFSMNLYGEDPPETDVPDGDLLYTNTFARAHNGPSNIADKNLYIRGTEGVTNIFESFSRAALTPVQKNAKVHDSVNTSVFNIYEMDGYPRIAIYDSFSNYVGEATEDTNGQITWDIGTLTPGETYTMVYYIKFTPQPNDPNDVSYYISGSQPYVEFDSEDKHYVKYFPTVFLQPSIYSTPAPNPVHMNSFDSTVIDAQGIIPNINQTVNAESNNSLAASPWGTPMPAYTASVTMTPKPTRSPTPSSITDEPVDEGVESIPVTGSERITIAIVLALLAPCAFGLSSWMKKKS